MNKTCVVHRGKNRSSMPALGQKRTSKQVCTMSALPPKADIVQYDRDVRFVLFVRHHRQSSSVSRFTADDQAMANPISSTHRDDRK
jgi:hypothetical protein